MQNERTGTHNIDLRRHGHKNFETGQLTPEGIEAARNEGEIIFNTLLGAEPNTVYYCVPSNVVRSQETRDAIEERIKKLVSEQPEGNIEIIDYALQDTIKKDGKRYVVTNVPPEARIGFDPKGPSNSAFDDLRAPLENEEEYIARVWVAREDELDQLKKDIRERYPLLSDVDIDRMQPAAFVTTPEEIALNQLEGIEQTTLAMNAAHPGQPLVGTYIGHAPSVDFVAMAVLGQEITLANFKAVEGLREYLESSTFQVEGDEVVMASFRGRSLAVGEKPVTLTSIKERLRAQSDARKRGWHADK